MLKLSIATSKPEMDAKHVKISPRDWRGEGAIRVEFHHQLPVLANLKKVELATLKSKLSQRQVVLVETDGACSGNADAKGPGG
jgi:hypothetical protein